MAITPALFSYTSSLQQELLGLAHDWCDNQNGAFYGDCIISHSILVNVAVVKPWTNVMHGGVTAPVNEAPDLLVEALYNMQAL